MPHPLRAESGRNRFFGDFEIMINSELLVQDALQRVFNDPNLTFDKTHFAGGLTNYNYIMEIHGKHYVVREPGVLTERMLNRPAEQSNNIIASELGINSACIYFDPKTGIKICEYIPHSMTLAALDPGSPNCLRSVAALLKTTHASPKPFSNTFNWENELLKYERLTQDQCGQLFSDYPFLKEQLLHYIHTHVASFETIPCHNDTVPENFLMDTEANQPYLIDWEYSGMNDPTWDIAMYIAESHLSNRAIVEFFSYYYGASGPTRDELSKIRCFIMAQDLLWSIWALVRHYSGEDFLDYCYNRYNRFRRNLKNLEENEHTSLSDMVKW